MALNNDSSNHFPLQNDAPHHGQLSDNILADISAGGSSNTMNNFWKTFFIKPINDVVKPITDAVKISE